MVITSTSIGKKKIIDMVYSTLNKDNNKNITQEVIKDCYDEIFNTITSCLTQNCLVDSYKITLQGLGTLKIKPTKERKAINPQTRESIIVPAGRRLVFTAGAGIKSNIQSKVNDNKS